jgi:xanthine dehydrogenase accessory factor
MDLALLKNLNAARAARRATVLISNLDSGEQRLVGETDDLAADPLRGEIEARFRSGKSGRIDTGAGRSLFLKVDVPPARLVLIGAVHISQALGPMAQAVGFDVTIIDPRTAFATPERFAGLDLRPEWPQDVLPELGLDRHTALAALTHDPKIDDPALTAAFAADCFYIGALGSRKTHGKRLERLIAAGVSEQALAGVHAPIGLRIGAATPAEIAVAALAEIIAARRRPGTEAKAAA